MTVILHLTTIVVPDESRNQLEEFIKLIKQKKLAVQWKRSSAHRIFVQLNVFR